jgi:hypothetical protein
MWLRKNFKVLVVSTVLFTSIRLFNFDTQRDVHKFTTVYISLLTTELWVY